MKRLLLVLSLVGTQLNGMDLFKPAQVAKTVNTYVNVNQLLGNLVMLSLNDEAKKEESAYNGANIAALAIDALKLQAIPVKIGSFEGTLEDVFVTKELKKVAKKIARDYTSGSCSKNMTAYCWYLKDCVKWRFLMNELKNHLS